MFRKIGIDVFKASLERIRDLYKGGHRIVVTVSGGKDSTVCLELCRIVARELNMLPVEAIMRDEEIMPPGTFEYLERLHNDKEIDLHWVIAGQPLVNSFSRKKPYWWVFDSLEKDKWVRNPPKYAEWINENSMEGMVTKKKFPVKKNQNLYSIMGLRMYESRNRKLGMLSSVDHITSINKFGTYKVRPIYDWVDNDVWKAIYDNKWDYNKLYDVMSKHGVSKRDLRVAPPTLHLHIRNLKYYLIAFPKWFNKIAKRVEGVRTAAQFGMRSIHPIKLPNETWEQCGKRIYSKKNSPDWIVDRFNKLRDTILYSHKKHSKIPFDETKSCQTCRPDPSSWKKLVNDMYMGDPFSQKNGKLPYMEPEFFRTGSGKW